MLSEKQLAANRANAQKSTGPKTEEGKRRSSLNAARHGLTGQVVVLPAEDMEAFNQFTSGIVASLEPANHLERQLAHSYASFQWRINRAAAIEDNLFTVGLIQEEEDNSLDIEHPEVRTAVASARTFRADSQEFARLSLYSSRLINQAEKVLKQLKQMQAERLHREQVELSQAVGAYRAHQIAGVPFDPQANGFVCTTPRIEAYIRRQNLNNPDFVAEEAARKAA